MQFLTDPKVDFMKYRGFFVWVSIALLVIACVELFFLTGINFGIDFAGGTQLTVRLRDPLEIDELRQIMAAAGHRDAQIQRYGPRENQEVLIKAPVVGDSEEGSSKVLLEALDRDLNGGEQGFDLNQRGTEAISSLLFEADPDDRRELDEDEAQTHYDAVAEAVIEKRNEVVIFDSWDQVASVPEVSEEVLALFEDRGFLGEFHVLQNENVGPQIGSELRTKGLLAVVLSFLGMLLYIWYRFELRFGVGALVAVVHDFMITLGLFAILNFEFNLSTIAAFLTLVGYSVNDTVVIFDRVRENMRRFRRMPLIETMNLSINQTLSRTVLTSGTTLLVVACLFFLGGEVLRGFAFVLLAGVIIGTYSSVFVASPFTLLWEKYFSQEAKDRREGRKRTQTA
jgi:preprotein translocase subunit SecF